MPLPKYTNDFDVVLCDASGAWLPDTVEEKYEKDFFELLHSCDSYEEFMMKAELMQADFDFEWLGFESSEDLEEYVRMYYDQHRR